MAIGNMIYCFSLIMASLKFLMSMVMWQLILFRDNLAMIGVLFSENGCKLKIWTDVQLGAVHKWRHSIRGEGSAKRWHWLTWRGGQWKSDSDTSHRGGVVAKQNGEFVWICLTRRYGTLWAPTACSYGGLVAFDHLKGPSGPP